MFGLFNTTLPVSDEDRQWVDGALTRLGDLLGWERMLGAKVMLPVVEDFPDRYDGSEAALLALFRRVATRMEVDPSMIRLEVFDDTHEMTRALVPFWSGRSKGAGGLYREVPDAEIEISVKRAKLKDPMALVATLAHELSHAILLGRRLIDPEFRDMEPMTDLLTVFLGFGVFNANSAFQFSQYTNNDSQGWSTQRNGYLSEEIYGYALARFAFERRETKPGWAKHLSTNVSAYFKRSMAWLTEHGERLKV